MRRIAPRLVFHIASPPMTRGEKSPANEKLVSKCAAAKIIRLKKYTVELLVLIFECDLRQNKYETSLSSKEICQLTLTECYRILHD